MSRATFLFFLILFLFHPAIHAGSQHKRLQVPSARAIIGQETGPRTVSLQTPYPGAYTGGPGDSIGFTMFDYNTNGSAYRNLINHGDGTLSLARLAATDSLNLGSWFSCSSDDGFTWEPLTLVEEIGAAFSTSIDALDAAGGTEIVLSKGRADLQLNINASRCAAVWTNSSGPSEGSFPRFVIGSGFDLLLVYVHLPDSVCFASSSDLGMTWTIMCSGQVVDADGYDLAARETNFAFVTAGAGRDVVLVRSYDNGATWTEQVIYDVAGPGELPPDGEEWQPDGACAVVIDSDGNSHVVWSNYLAVGDSNSNPALFYSTEAGIMYWSDASGVLEIGLPTQDPTMDPPPGRDGNFASQPDIAVDDDFNLPFVLFSQLISERDDSLRNYEHVFGVCSYDGGMTWGEPSDIMYGNGFDASFPSLADRVERGGGLLTVHIVYNSDPLAGNWVSGNHPQIPVAIKYLRHGYIDVSVNGAQGEPREFALEQNYPNPFNPVTTFSFSLRSSVFANLSIYDVLGRRVATLVNEKLAPGTYTREWNATGHPRQTAGRRLDSSSELASGVYFYRLQAGDFMKTMKLVLVR